MSLIKIHGVNYVCRVERISPKAVRRLPVFCVAAVVLQIVKWRLVARRLARSLLFAEKENCDESHERDEIQATTRLGSELGKITTISVQIKGQISFKNCLDHTIL